MNQQSENFSLLIKNIPKEKNIEEILLLFMETESKTNDVIIHFNKDKTMAVVEFHNSQKTMDKVIECIKARPLFKANLDAEVAIIKKRLIIKNVAPSIDEFDLTLHFEKFDLDSEVNIEMNSQLHVAIATLASTADLDKYLQFDHSFLGKDVTIKKCDYFTNLSDFKKPKAKNPNKPKEPANPVKLVEDRKEEEEKEGNEAGVAGKDSRGRGKRSNRPWGRGGRGQGGRGGKDAPINVEGCADDFVIIERQSSANDSSTTDSQPIKSDPARSKRGQRANQRGQQSSRGRGRGQGTQDFGPSGREQHVDCNPDPQLRSLKMYDNRLMKRSQSQSSLCSELSEYSVPVDLLSINFDKVAMGKHTEIIINVTNEIFNEKCTMLIWLSRSLYKPHCRFTVDKNKHTVRLSGSESDVKQMHVDTLTALNNMAYTRLQVGDKMAASLMSLRGIAKMKELMVNLGLRAKILHEHKKNLQVFGENRDTSRKGAQEIEKLIQRKEFNLKPGNILNVKTEKWKQFVEYIEGNLLVTLDINIQEQKLTLEGFGEDFVIAVNSTHDELLECTLKEKISKSFQCSLLQYRFLKLFYQHLVKKNIRYDTNKSILILTDESEVVNYLAKNVSSIINDLKEQSYTYSCRGLSIQGLSRKDSSHRLKLEEFEKLHKCAIGFATEKIVPFSIIFTIVYQDKDMLERSNIYDVLKGVCEEMVQTKTIRDVGVILMPHIIEQFSTSKVKVVVDEIEHVIYVSGDENAVETIYNNIKMAIALQPGLVQLKY